MQKRPKQGSLQTCFHLHLEKQTIFKKKKYCSFKTNISQSTRHVAIVTAAAAMASSGTKHLRELEERFLESGKPEEKCIDSAGPGSSHERLVCWGSCQSHHGRCKWLQRAWATSTGSQGMVWHFTQVEHVGGHSHPQLLRQAHLGVFTCPTRTHPRMISTQLKAIARRNMVTQVKLPEKHAAVQISTSSGCRECLSLASVSEGKREDTCMWCDQIDDQPGDRAYRGSKAAKAYQGVWERNRLVVTPFHPWEKCSLWNLDKNQKNPDSLAIRQNEEPTSTVRKEREIFFRAFFFNTE